MTHKEYNGWTNYETWNVNLWMDNDEGSQEHYRELAQECYDRADSSGHLTREERATLSMADALKSEFEDGECDVLEQAGVTASVWADLLGAALSEVNWHEIAEHYIAEVDKDAEPVTDDERSNGPRR